MSYQIYFADLAEEIKALVFTLLRLKSEAGTLDSKETDLLVELRGSAAPPFLPGGVEVTESQPRLTDRESSSFGGRPRRNSSSTRRRPSNGGRRPNGRTTLPPEGT